MQKRKLGRSGIEVPPIAIGGNVFGWTADERTSFEVLDRAVDRGLTFIDTADVYSRWAPGHRGGESETILGKWMKQRGNRDRIVVATKVGMDMGEGKKGLSRKHILTAIDDSLRRLQTEQVDLYQAHQDDQDTPLEETLSAFAELIAAGKVRAIGASNYTGARLQEAIDTAARLGVPRYESLQPEYNLYERKAYESDLEPVCVRNGLGVISYYSLASGFLTGKYRGEKDLGQSPRGQKVKAMLNDRGFRILEALDEVAQHHNTDQAAVALAWLIARPSITAPIASATKPEQVDSLAAAAELKLTDEELRRLDKASAE
jgi:aryl-alcohol dehydrogenase-like predicted oxidoreductase